MIILKVKIKQKVKVSIKEIADHDTSTFGETLDKQLEEFSQGKHQQK